MKQKFRDWLTFSNVASAVALLLSGLTFLKDFYLFSREFVPPEAFSKLEEYSLGPTERSGQLQVKARMTFSLSNQGSEVLHIVGCQVDFLEARHGGADSIASASAACMKLDGEVVVGSEIEISPGQTKFFVISSSFTLDASDEEAFLLAHVADDATGHFTRNFHLQPCAYTSSNNGNEWGFSQLGCSELMYQHLVDLRFTTGTGSQVIIEHSLGKLDQWPWSGIDAGALQ